MGEGLLLVFSQLVRAILSVSGPSVGLSHCGGPRRADGWSCCVAGSVAVARTAAPAAEGDLTYVGLDGSRCAEPLWLCWTVPFETFQSEARPAEGAQ